MNLRYYINSIMNKVIVGILIVTAVVGFRIEQNEGRIYEMVAVDPQKCIEEKCPKEWADCQKDPKCVPTL